MQTIKFKGAEIAAVYGNNTPQMIEPLERVAGRIANLKAGKEEAKSGNLKLTKGIELEIGAVVPTVLSTKLSISRKHTGTTTSVSIPDRKPFITGETGEDNFIKAMEKTIREARKEFAKALLYDRKIMKAGRKANPDLSQHAAKINAIGVDNHQEKVGLRLVG